MNRTALITGASSGIGYELSKIFAAEGYDLVLVARSQGKLEKIAAELSAKHAATVTVLAKDLGNPASPKDIFTELESRAIAVDVLVNNAGFGTYGRFANLDLGRELEMIQVDVVSLTHLTRLFLPGMLERGFGRIMNIGSTGSFAPAPLMSAYAACKVLCTLVFRRFE